MASVTFTYTTQQAQRVATAFGAELGLGRDATGAEVKAEIWNFVREVVKRREREAAVAAAVATAEAALADLGGAT